MIGEIRREKAEKSMPLNTQIKTLTIHAGSKKSAHILDQALEDVQGTCKIQKITVIPRKGEGREVQDYPNVRFITTY